MEPQFHKVVVKVLVSIATDRTKTPLALTVFGTIKTERSGT